MQQTQIVLNEGYGKVINQLFVQWDKVKTISQYNKWKAKVKSTNFGTYGTIGILEVLENFTPVFRNEIIKNNFINEVKEATIYIFTQVGSKMFSHFHSPIF